MLLPLCNINNWIKSTLLLSFGVFSAAAQPYAYVANLSGNNVTIVNTANNTLVKTLSVGAAPNACISPSGAAVTPDGAFAYIACQGSNNVSVISSATFTVVNTVPVGATPIAVAVNPNGAQAYVVNRGSNSVSVIDNASKSVIATIPVGSRPLSVAFSPDGLRAYVANLWSVNVSIIDTASKSVIGTIPMSTGPNAVAVGPNGHVYVSNGATGNVTVHDSAGSLQSTISGFVSPNSIAVSNTGRVVVSNGNGASTSLATAAGIITTLPTGTIPTSVAITPDGARAYVTNEYSLTLSAIDLTTNTVTKTFNFIGAYPIAVGIQGPPATAPIVGGPPPGPTCTFTLSAPNASFGSSGGPGSVNVSTAPGCSWSVTNSLSWVHLSAGTAGTGPGTVSYNVDANTGAGALNGSLTIAGQSYGISQTGLACSYSLSAPSTNLGSPAGGGSFNVTAGAGCSWSSSTDQPTWLTITSGFTGNGNGTVGFSVSANGGTGSRIGHVTAGGQQYTVTQSGTAFTSIRINCGGPQITDPSGNVWVTDNATNYSATNAAIANTTTPALYQKDAWSTGTLQYQFSVPNGSFTVTLKFAEFYLSARGQRVFNIVVNGTTLLAGFDILANASGMNAAYDVSLPVTVTNGQITIQLVPVTGTPKVNGIQITSP